MLPTENGAEVLTQRVEPDVLDGQDRFVSGALFTTTGGFSDVNPIGGVVASAAMAWSFDEGFQQYRAVSVTMMPIVGQLPMDD